MRSHRPVAILSMSTGLGRKTNHHFCIINARLTTICFLGSTGVQIPASSDGGWFFLGPIDSRFATEAKILLKRGIGHPNRTQLSNLLRQHSRRVSDFLPFSTFRLFRTAQPLTAHPLQHCSHYLFGIVGKTVLNKIGSIKTALECSFDIVDEDPWLSSVPNKI